MNEIEDTIPLPVKWYRGAHGDPVPVFDGIVLFLHNDGSVTWEQIAPSEGEHG